MIPFIPFHFHTITNDMNNKYWNQSFDKTYILTRVKWARIWQARLILHAVDGNVFPLDTCMQLHPHGSYDSDGRPLDLTPSSTNITAFGGHVIQQYGILYNSST